MTKQLRFPTGPRPTPVTHLDEYTRRIGRAGVADARAILARCAPTVLDSGAGLSRRCPDRVAPAAEEFPEECPDERDQAIDGADPGLPTAA